MKKTMVLLAAAAALIFTATAVLAGGDKVHGDKGQGGVVQNCIQPGECPWE